MGPAEDGEYVRQVGEEGCLSLIWSSKINAWREVLPLVTAFDLTQFRCLTLEAQVHCLILDCGASCPIVAHVLHRIRL